MDFYELINNRQSQRSYNGEAVSEGLLMKIMEAGRLAPSATNGQPWRFVAVSGGEKAEKTRKFVMPYGFNKFCSAVQSFIYIIEDRPNISEKLAQTLIKRDFVPIDIGIATAHMVLCAETLGVSSCIIGAFGNPKKIEIEELVNQPIRLVLALGYKDDMTIRPKKRKDIDKVCSFLK